jgi:hypothetical protein
MKSVIFILLTSVIFSCRSKKDHQKLLAIPEFEFSIPRDSIPKKGFIKYNVPISIANKSADTIYLLSSNCYGPELIASDTSKFNFLFLTECDPDWFVVKKIVPNATLTFVSSIHNINADDSINIGARFMKTNYVNFDKLSYSEMIENSKIYWTTIKL